MNGKLQTLAIKSNNFMINPSNRINCSSTKLPSTMAGLLKVAIDEARNLDHATYFPNFKDWHNPHNNSFCEICLAGCIIAGQFNASPNDNYTSSSFDVHTENLLHAIDLMRNGQWRQAFCLIHGFTAPLHLDDYLHEIPAISHSNFYGWEQFIAHLASLEKLIPILSNIDRAAARHARSLTLRSVVLPSPAQS